MNPILRSILIKPYVLLVEVYHEDDSDLVAACGRSPDDHARSAAGLCAAFHYPDLGEMISELRKIHHYFQMTGQPRRMVVSDARVQLVSPPVLAELAPAARAMRGLALRAPFIVSAIYPDPEFDVVGIVGRAPFTVVGDEAIFTFGDFDEAIAACTRLALADGTLDGDYPMDAENS